MNSLNRRQCFTTFLGGLLGAAGSVVLARAALPARAAATPPTADAKDLEKRADQVAGDRAVPPEEDDRGLAAFVNGAFRNAGFANGGGFRKGAFVNGGFANGGFRKAGWVNGGWRN